MDRFFILLLLKRQWHSYFFYSKGKSDQLGFTVGNVPKQKRFLTLQSGKERAAFRNDADEISLIKKSPSLCREAFTINISFVVSWAS